MQQLSSSVRTIEASLTVERAWPVARRLGVTRCTETTWLDRIGIPVFSATRPSSQHIVVTAGKGRLRTEAHAGALMEAIEQAVAERTGQIAADSGHVRWLTPRQVVDQGGIPVGALCPTAGRAIDIDRPIAWLTCDEIISRTSILLPAELIFFPCPQELTCGWWGSTTTGLASGNTRTEAILHGLCEVLERDETAFEMISPRSALVDPGTLPLEIKDMLEKIRSADLDVTLRSIPSKLGAMFSCLIVDRDFDSPLACYGGYGFHPIPAVAAVRAISEAAQSRSTFIQGGRASLADQYSRNSHRSGARQKEIREELVRRHSNTKQIVDFQSISAIPAADPENLLGALLKKCEYEGFGRVGIYDFPPLASPFWVVKIIVPLAEVLNETSYRAGPRMIAYVRGLREQRP